MPLETDISVSPYHDDYDESKKFYKIGFKPSIAVQTRELNQLQTMFQTQIERFGNNIFKRGTIIDGVNFIFYNRYPYAKIRDVTVAGQNVIPEDYEGLFVKNESGLTAYVMNYKDGFESTDPDLKTIYLKYTSSGNSYSETKFSAGQVLTAYDSNNSIHSLTISASGTGYTNSDVVVLTPQLLVNVNSGSVSVGDNLTDSISGANGVVTAVEDQTSRLPRNMLPGSVSVSSASNVEGTSTSFLTDFTNGDYVAIYSNSTSYDLMKINAVTNNIFMNLTSNISFTNGAATYANTTDSYVYVTYRPTTADLANTSANSLNWSFTVGNTVVSNTASGVFEIVENIGQNAAASVTTDSAGRISRISVTNQGTGYYRVPRSSVKTTSGTSASLVAKNFHSQITVSSLSGSVGEGYAFGITEGVIYQKGYFIKVDPQIIIVDKYSRSPDSVTVGFVTNEEVITSSIDTTLLDNATGSSNFAAPGADRIKLTANLVVNSISTVSANSEFFNIVEWSNGYPYKQNSRTFYNVLGDHIAEGITDGHGDFSTDRFMVTTTSPSNSALSANTINIVIDPGSAYIDGRKVQTLTNYSETSDKALETRIEPSARVSLNYENYVRINELGGMFEFDQAATVDLYDTQKAFLSNNDNIADANTNPSGTKIGEARIRNLALEQGTPGTPEAVYRLYLFDVNMNSGANFRNVRAIHQTGSNFDGIADTVTGIDPTTSAVVSSIVARNNSLIFYAGFQSPLNSNNITYEYKTTDDTQEIANTGIVTISLVGDPNKTFPYTGTLSDSQKLEIFLAPAANIYAQANLTGTVNVATTSANVTGVGTTFLSEIKTGQYINLYGGASNNDIRRVVSVTNNSLLTIDANSNFTQAGIDAKLAWPGNVPIQLSYNSNYVVNTASSDAVLNINLGESLSTASNTDVIVSYNVSVADPTPTAKTPNRNQLVKIRLANNNSSTIGPWCLGIPDIFRLRAVYKGNSSVDTASSTVTDEFFIDHNQTSNYYNLGYLYKKNLSSTLLTDDDYLLVEYDAFTASPGFYTVASYVSSNKATRYTEDSKALADLSSTINTFEVPEIFDDKGLYYDLISSVDFRPYVAATANITSNTAEVTINPANTVAFSATDRYFPVPDSIYTHDIEYFLPRIDSITIDKNGKFNVINGTPGEYTSPRVPTGTMKLNDILIPSYPALPERVSNAVFDVIYTNVGSNKYNTRRVEGKKIRSLFNNEDLDREQPKAYTEYDIGALERRISDIEYYIGLTAVETSLKDRIIPSSVSPSIDRFKYGFFVDDYDNKDNTELKSPEYNASLLQSFAIPAIVSFNVVHEGDATSSPYTSIELVSQNLATEPAEVVPPPPPPTNDYFGMLIVAPDHFKSQTYKVKEESNKNNNNYNKGSNKIVCTAMNESYGFGSFRNSIWLEHSAKYMKPEHEAGYHAVFLPLVDYVYRSDAKDSIHVKMIRTVGERIARKRTSDLWKMKKGKMDLEGRIYRLILEPLCYVAGKIRGAK